MSVIDLINKNTFNFRIFFFYFEFIFYCRLITVIITFNLLEFTIWKRADSK